MDWFLYDIGLRHEKIKKDLINLINTWGYLGQT